jgi:hypothetical protein
MEEAVACVNIGPREQQKRMRFGVAGLAAGVALAAALALLGGNRWLRLLTFVPFCVGAAGVLQARAKT